MSLTGNNVKKGTGILKPGRETTGVSHGEVEEGTINCLLPIPL